MEGFCSMLRAGCKQMQKYVPYKQLLGLNYFKNLWVLVNDSFNRKFSQNTFTDILGTRKKKGEDWNKHGIIQVYRKIIS